jgi:succinate dehydrogenase / fumarate reductase iron-sulfur subunit
MSTETETDTESETEEQSEPEIGDEPEPEPPDPEESPGDRRRGERRSRAADRRREQAEIRAQEAAEAGETIHLKVFRYDPEIEGKQEPRFDDFHVPREPGMTVLDALMYARDHFDSSLTFRHSCRQAVCGSDAFFVNGSQMLGCQTQIQDLDGDTIRVEPLPHQDVIKDLVVDMQHFYEQMDAVEPYFQPDETPDNDLEEQRQSPANRDHIKMSTRCIWCGACASSCNIAAEDNQYLGPAAINQAYRFYMDEREGTEMQEERMEIIAETHGVWRCQTQFSCTNVCPKDIPLTEHIQELKREAVKSNLKFW